MPELISVCRNNDVKMPWYKKTVFETSVSSQLCLNNLTRNTWDNRTSQSLWLFFLKFATQS